MAQLSVIATNIKELLGYEVYGHIQRLHYVNGVRFLTKEDSYITHLEPNVLYLGQFSEYGNDTFYGDVLLTGCHDCKCNDQYLYLKEDVDLIVLYHAVEEAFLASQRLEYKKQALFQILHNGQGIETLLKASYNYLNNPLTLCDSSYNILAAYPELDDSEHVEFNKDRHTIKKIFTENMLNEHITDRIYHSIFPFATTISDSDHEWIFQSIRIRNAVVGYICVRVTEREYTDDDLDLIHYLTQMISIQLQKDDSYRNPQSLKYDMFLKELFAHHWDDDDVIEKQLKNLGVKPRQYYCLIYCAFLNNSGKLMSYHYYLQQLSALFPNSVTGVFGNRFATLIATSDLTCLSESQARRFETFLTMNRMLATVSYVYDSPKESPAYSAQCNSLLSQRLMTYNESPIIYYRDYYLNHMFSSIRNKEYVTASINPSIKFMQKYDAQHHTDYYRSLEVFIDNNRNAQATANALFIHKSTLFYRFDKMKQLFDIDINDKDALFSYEYSIRLIRSQKNR